MIGEKLASLSFMAPLTTLTESARLDKTGNTCGVTMPRIFERMGAMANLKFSDR